MKIFTHRNYWNLNILLPAFMCGILHVNSSSASDIAEPSTSKNLFLTVQSQVSGQMKNELNEVLQGATIRNLANMLPWVNSLEPIISKISPWNLEKSLTQGR